MATKLPLAAAANAMSNDLNDEGYSDNEPPQDSSIIYTLDYDPRGDLPPPSSLPEFIMAMPEAQRTGTCMKPPTPAMRLTLPADVACDCDITADFN
jgi:hypothetical protein